MVKILRSLHWLVKLIKSTLFTLMLFQQKWAKANTSTDRFSQVSFLNSVVGILACSGLTTMPLPAEWKMSLLLTFSWSVTAISILRLFAEVGM